MSTIHLQHVVRHVALDRILLACNRLLRNTANWRCHFAFLSSLRTLCNVLHIDNVHATFTSLLKDEALSVRALPCREISIECLLLVLRRTGSAYRRNTLLDFFTNTLALHKSYHKRMLFLYACQKALDMFSRQFFIRHLLDAMLQMSEDKVVNVRIRLCRLLPSIKRKLLLPDNALELRQVENVVKSLLSSSINESIKSLVQEIALNLSKTDTCSTSESQTDNKRFIDECQTFGEDATNNNCTPTTTENHSSPSLYATLPRVPKSIANNNNSDKPIISSPSIMTRSYSDISSVTATILLPAPTPVTRTLTQNASDDQVKPSPVKLLSVVTSEPTVATMASLKEYAPPSPSYEEVKEEIFKSTIATAITPPLHQRTARTPSKLAVVKPQKIIERMPSPRPNTEMRPRKDSNTTLEQTKAAIKNRVETVKGAQQQVASSDKSENVCRLPPKPSYAVRTAPVRDKGVTKDSNEPIPPPRTRAGLMTSSSASSIPVRTRYTIQTTTRESSAGTTAIRYTSRRDSGTQLTLSSSQSSLNSTNIPHRRSTITASSTSGQSAYALMKVSSAEHVRRLSVYSQSRLRSGTNYNAKDD